MIDLTGKTAVVFGGNGNVGNNLIKKLFLHKIDSVYTSFHTNSNNILELKKKYGDKLSLNQVDVRNYIATQKFVENIQNVDIGINCVGIIDDHSVSKLELESVGAASKQNSQKSLLCVRITLGTLEPQMWHCSSSLIVSRQP